MVDRKLQTHGHLEETSSYQLRIYVCYQGELLYISVENIGVASRSGLRHSIVNLKVKWINECLLCSSAVNSNLRRLKIVSWPYS